MSERPYRILMPVTRHAATVPVLEMASSLISAHQGELIALGVVKVPFDRSYSYGTLRAYRHRRLIKRLTSSEPAKDMTVRSVVKVGREASPEVFKAADEHGCDLIVLGWDAFMDRNYFGGRFEILAEQTGQDIAIIKPGEIKKHHNVLVPMRGGVHATLAMDIAAAICNQFDANLTMMHVFEGDENQPPIKSKAAADPNFPSAQTTDLITVTSNDIASTIVEHGRDFDFIILGSSLLSPDRVELGPISKAVAKMSKATVIIIKSRQPDPIPIFEPYRLEEFGDWNERAEKLPDFVDKWFAENTFDASEFEPIDELVGLKKRQGKTISLGLPTLNEEETIGDIIKTFKEALMDEHQLLDEMVVIDSGSTDKTVEIAKSFDIPVYQHAELLPEHGSYRGKGEALWKSLYLLNGDIIAWVDTDIQKIHPSFVYGLIGPILRHPQIQYTKGFYHRPLKVDGGILKTGGGRVTELTARPLINLFFPALSGLVQPLSGEYAGTRRLLEQLAFYTGYGVEMGLLIDILHKFGLPVIGQVDLKQRIHRNQSLEALSKMSFAIIHATMDSLQASHKVRLLQKISRRMNLIHRGDASFHLESEEIFDDKRLPILNIPEYRQKFMETTKV